MQRIAKATLALFLGAFLCGTFLPALAQAGQPVGEESLQYLKDHQDILTGGLIEDLEITPSSIQSAWGAIAFASASYDPATVGDNVSLLGFVQNEICAATSATDIERNILVASAADEDARTLGGCDLIAQLDAQLNIDGSIGPDLTSTVFGVLAYTAANEIVPPDSIDYILSKQEVDGGWSSGWGTEANITAQTINALAVSGLDKQSQAILSAKQYLKNLQTNTGGIKYDNNSWTTNSDAFSNAYTLQAIYSLNETPDDIFWQSSSGKTIIDDLSSLRNNDGSYSFSLTYGLMNPVYTTAVVIPAIEGKPLGFTGNNLVSYKDDASPAYDSNSSPQTDTASQSAVTQESSDTVSIHQEEAIQETVSNPVLQKTFIDNTTETVGEEAQEDVAYNKTTKETVLSASTQTNSNNLPSNTTVVLLIIAAAIGGTGLSLLLNKSKILPFIVLLCIVAVPTFGLANQAGLVVRHGDGSIKSECINFDSEYITSLELLTAADMNPVLDNGFVTSLDGERAKSYNEAGVTDDYWSFWTHNNEWIYSNLGAKYSKVYGGTLNGWQKGDSNLALPQISFQNICTTTEEYSAQSLEATTQSSNATEIDNTALAPPITTAPTTQSPPATQEQEFTVMADTPSSTLGEENSTQEAPIAGTGNQNNTLKTLAIVIVSAFLLGFALHRFFIRTRMGNK